MGKVWLKLSGVTALLLGIGPLLWSVGAVFFYRWDLSREQGSYGPIWAILFIFAAIHIILGVNLIMAKRWAVYSTFVLSFLMIIISLLLLFRGFPLLIIPLALLAVYGWLLGVTFVAKAEAA